jgi:glutamyl-tRNA synthetase
MTVVTRFAPSPTGYLHIGGARTALFNWLYARHHGGKFLLRIEDTDRARSTQDAVAAILTGLEWLGLDHDGEPVSQHQQQARHAEVAHRLLEEGKAYRCYCSQEELAEMRERARAEGRPIRYDGTWRDRDPADAPEGVQPVIRLKTELEGDTVIRDHVQGEVRVANAEIDDFILLRADGTPTYMLAVVVDDLDMGVTHVIRGDDHLNNAFRQAQIYKAMGWDLPEYAHVPLIHGPDGAKLSKRHGATAVGDYGAMGILPEAMRNYLLRLGWSHGDDEIISTEQAIDWFTLETIGRSPARFDTEKLMSLNAHYMREAAPDRLLGLIAPRLEAHLGRRLDETARGRLEAGMPGLTSRVRNLNDLADFALFYVTEGAPEPDEKAAKLLTPDARALLGDLAAVLAGLDGWDEADLEAAVREFAATREVKLGAVAQPLRAALTGATVSPGIFEVLVHLGRAEALLRLKNAADA